MRLFFITLTITLLSFTNHFSQNIHVVTNPYEGGNFLIQDNTFDDGTLIYHQSHYFVIVNVSDVSDYVNTITDGYVYDAISKHFTPLNNNTVSLGSSSFQWQEVWAVNGTIQTSDANLKTNIIPTLYGLEAVLKMKPVTYNWKDDTHGKRKIGFLAQDMLDIVPEAVIEMQTSKDDKNFLNGKNERKASEAIYGMNYSELIPILTKAIQEQNVTIEKLKTDNQVLNARLDKVEVLLSKLIKS